MKKGLSLILAACLLGSSVCGCGDDGGTDSKSTGGTGTEAVQQDESYKVKSKISTANSAASATQKAVESTLTELDEKGVKLEYRGWIKFRKGAISADTELRKDNASELLHTGITNYLDKFDDLDGAFYIDRGSCVAVVATMDGEFVGSYPSGYTRATDYLGGGELGGCDISEQLGKVVQRFVDDPPTGSWGTVDGNDQPTSW
ncbi:MAG: hypothetical protein IKO47_12870 [Ruminococcus sp.]|nr:hypothetical protein [Ruminococcus sp.]